MGVETTLPGGVTGIIGGPLDETIEGTDGDDWIFGTEADDKIDAGAGNDLVQAEGGVDDVDGGAGDDTILGGIGDDEIEGGEGNDVARGDEGADTFFFDPSRMEGDDNIVDFTPEDGDVIALSATGLAAVGITEFSGAALDASEDFSISTDEETGDLVIEHPGGTITLNGVTVLEGEEAPTFAALEEAGALAVPGLIQGTDGPDVLPGTEDGDVIDALGGDDDITPDSGDDIVATGEGRDTVNLDPSNPDEGADVVTDFTAPDTLDPSVGDYINLVNVLEADPDLPAADGEASSLSPEDFDASANWTLGAGEGGAILFTHPGGSVEFTDTTFDGQTFAALAEAGVLKIDGEVFDEDIPVEPSEPVDPSEPTEPTEPDGGGDVVDGPDGEVPPVEEPMEEAIA
jgi:Ca2+-binding RTX toxin-like protein